MELAARHIWSMVGGDKQMEGKRFCRMDSMVVDCGHHLAREGDPGLEHSIREKDVLRFVPAENSAGRKAELPSRFPRTTGAEWRQTSQRCSASGQPDGSVQRSGATRGS